MDASFAVHDDTRSRTGTLFSLGKDVIYCASTKQKIVTSSSTEAELVGVVDVIPKILWCRHFMESQGCYVEDVYVYQDNQSVNLLETNGRESVGKGTRHVKIKYFFVTDKVKGKELNILYGPTKQIITNVYTKQLSGVLFKDHMNSILRINQDDIPLYLEQCAQFTKSIDID